MAANKTRVAYQGVEGAYSELAAKMFFGKNLAPSPCDEFESVFKQVKSGKSEFGILPVENSLTGSIHKNFDLLIQHSVWIYGEIKLRVSHNLLAVPGSSLQKIRKIYSHPQALQQCEGFIKTLKKAQQVPYFDTAGSARFVKEQNNLEIAAIAGNSAAEFYGLTPLAKGIEDNQHNFTRFIVIGKPGKKTPPKIKKDNRTDEKTSIVFALKNIPGALYKSLSIFAIRDIDLLKIESRPIHGSPWTYMFYLDLAGSHDEEKIKLAVAHLGEITEYLKVLGSYSRSPA